MSGITFSPAIINKDFTEQSKPDANGYYLLNAGAFNSHNRSGDYYPFTERVKRLFSSNSKLMRRIDEGQLYSEWGHPEATRGMKLDEWIRRVCSYDMDRYAAFTKKVQLIDAVSRDKKPIKLVRHHIKPHGPFGCYFEDQLTDPDMNPTLSVRSMTDDVLMSCGRWNKDVKSIWNWDVVDTGGIPEACKRDTSPSLESAEITAEDIYRASLPSVESDGVGLEADPSMVSQVLTDLGWENVPAPSVSNKNWMSNS